MPSGMARPGTSTSALDYTADEIVLTITDDGTGLPENARNGDGMGLRIMAYRADMIGATFHIERLSSLAGTRVTCTLAPKAYQAKKPCHKKLKFCSWMTIRWCAKGW